MLIAFLKTWESCFVGLFTAYEHGSGKSSFLSKEIFKAYNC